MGLSELWENLALVGGMNFMRYFFAGLAYLLFYVVFRRKWWMKGKYRRPFRVAADTARDFAFGAYPSMIFMGVFAGVAFLKRAGFTQIYTRFGDHSLWYFLFSVGVLIVMADTILYWTLYRLLHPTAVFRGSIDCTTVRATPRPGPRLLSIPWRPLYRAVLCRLSFF